jgi:hypothetical protein
LLKKLVCSPDFKLENKQQTTLPKYSGKNPACSKLFRASFHVRGSTVLVIKYALPSSREGGSYPEYKPWWIPRIQL